MLHYVHRRLVSLDVRRKSERCALSIHIAPTGKETRIAAADRHLGRWIFFPPITSPFTCKYCFPLSNQTCCAPVSRVCSIRIQPKGCCLHFIRLPYTLELSAAAQDPARTPTTPSSFSRSLHMHHHHYDEKQTDFTIADILHTSKTFFFYYSHSSSRFVIHALQPLRRAGHQMRNTVCASVVCADYLSFFREAMNL